MLYTFSFLNETNLFHGKQQYAVHFGNENYVDKYTRHVYISTVSFFSQLPKIKIAFNSYIYKYSDSSLYGLEESGSTVFQQSGFPIIFITVCPPPAPFRISAMCSCAETMAERKH